MAHLRVRHLVYSQKYNELDVNTPSQCFTSAFADTPSPGNPVLVFANQLRFLQHPCRSSSRFPPHRYQLPTALSALYLAHLSLPLPTTPCLTSPVSNPVPYPVTATTAPLLAVTSKSTPKLNIASSKITVISFPLLLLHIALFWGVGTSRVVEMKVHPPHSFVFYPLL